MIKHLCRILCFILFFNFYVSNFGVKVKAQAQPVILDIEASRVINFTMRVDNKDIIFDFTSTLAENDKIEEFTLKRGTENLKTEAVNDSKKAWKSKFIPLNNDQFEINAVANIGGNKRKLVYKFLYNDYDSGNEPELKFVGNNFEAIFDEKWLSQFNDNEPIEIYAESSYGNTLINRVQTTAKKLKDAQRKQVWDDVKKNFGDNSGYWLHAKVKGREYTWKLYTQNRNSNLTVQVMPVELKKATFNTKNKTNVDYEVELKNKVTLATQDRLRRVSGKYSEDNDFNKKTRIGKILDENLSFNTDHTMRLEQASGAIEGKFSLCKINKFEKLNCKVEVPAVQTNSLNIKLLGEDKSFLSKTDGSNKLYIYELNDNFTKGTKIGQKLSGVTYNNQGNMVNLNNGVILSNNKNYLVELTNGTRTIESSFVYLTMSTTSSEVTETSAKIGWTYPSGYTPVSGDKVDIYLRDVDNTSEYTSIPKVSLIHNGSSVNLTNKTSEVVPGLAPGTNYEAKIILNNQRGNIVSFTKFTTKPFTLKDYIGIRNSFYDTSSYWKVARHRSRTLTVEWDFEPENMRFSDGDKVEIFIKPNGSSQFSGYPENNKYNNPVFIKTTNLSTTKSAEITIPSWLDHYHVDLIYTIGGKKIINRKPADVQGEEAYNRKTVQVTVNKPDIIIEDIKQTTAKMKWEYDHGFNPQGDNVVRYVPENGHIIKAHIRKVNSLTDVSTNFDDNNSKLLFEYTHGVENVNLLEKKEFDITGLEPGQFYRIQLTHILQVPGFDNRYRAVDEYYSFTTGAFSIEGLKGEQDKKSREIKVSWRTTGEVQFDETDKVKIYIKEGTQSDYPEKPNYELTRDKIDEFIGNAATKTDQDTNTEGNTEVIKNDKGCKISVDKYNTPYNVKVEYMVKGKPISNVLIVEAEGELGVNVSEINETSAKLDVKLPDGYKKIAPEGNNTGDKIKLTVTEHESEEAALKNDGNVAGKGGSTFVKIENKELTISDENKVNKEELTKLTANKFYKVVVDFENNNSIVHTVQTVFKATGDLQITNLVASDVKSKTATINWKYVPDKELKGEENNTSTVEIYIKEISKTQSRNTPDYEGYKKIFKANYKDGAKGELPKNPIDVSKKLANEDIKEGEILNLDEANFKKLGSIMLTGLDVNKQYSLYVHYDNMDEKGQQEDKRKADSEVRFKTIADTFKATVFSVNQNSATFGWEYPVGYELQAGDKIEIFVKEINKDNSIDNGITNDYDENKPLLTLIHGTGEGKVDLNEVTRVDMAGLTPKKEFKAMIKFTMGTGDNAYSIKNEVSINTKEFSIKSFKVDSYQEYDILVSWEIEPEKMLFGAADTLEIFVKRATDEKYPDTPSYKLPSNEADINTTFSDYVLAETIGEPQKMKMVYTVGGKKFEKELEFTNSIDPVKAELFSVDSTRALVQIESPTNYEFVSGDKLLVYAKDEFAGDGELESDQFLVFEGLQSDSASIPDDMRLIELSYLLPEAKYEVLVKLDLLDGKSESSKFEFTTKPMPVTDIKLESIKHDTNTISWNYGDKEVDFFKDEDYTMSDKLIIAHKESNSDPMPEDIDGLKKLSHKEYLGEDIKSVKDANIQVEDPSKDYDVTVCYEIGGLRYIRKMKASYLSVSSDESALDTDKARINWKYPSNLTLGDSDKTEVFIRKKSETNYPESSSTSSTGSGNTSHTFESLEGDTEYVAKVQITKEGFNIDPVEVEFKTKPKAATDVTIENIDYQIQGTTAQFAIPNAGELDIDQEKPLELSMGEEAYKGFKARLNDEGTGFIIEPTIPKKKYENIEVQIPLKDGTVMQIVIKEFVTEPENLTQDWLSNAYWFAFERFPDEEGYNYWYNDRMVAKKLNGEYFLKNLMFAEDEFTNRNLNDKDLIASLYQIVVNREFDEEGLNFWIGIYNENLKNAQGNKKLAQETLVDRMVHEPEFGKLCDKVGIFWRQSDQDAAGVVS